MSTQTQEEMVRQFDQHDEGLGNINRWKSLGEAFASSGI